MHFYLVWIKCKQYVTIYQGLKAEFVQIEDTFS